MLDLRQIREDPQPARDALARRGVDPALLDEALELDERRRALLPELEDLRARKNQASKRIGELQRSGEDASEAIAETRGLSEREKELEEELRAVEERRTAVLLSLPNLPDPTARRRGRGDPRGRRGRQDRAQPRGAARRQPRHGARRARVGLALRLPEGAARAARAGARAVGAVAARRARLHPGDPAGARARAGALRHGHAARHRAAALPRARGRALPGRHLGGAAGVAARGRDPRAAASCRGATPASRPASGARPGAAGKDTQGLFRVHQFDKVEMFSFVEPERVAGRARAPARDRGGDPPGARDPVPGREHRRERPRRLGREEVRPRGVAAGAGPLPRAHLVLEHHRLPGAPARHPLPPRRGRGACATCTR